MWTPLAASLLLIGAAPSPPPLLSPAALAWVETQEQADLSQAFIALEDEYQDAYDAWRVARRAAIEAYNKARESGADVAFEGPVSIEPDFFPRFDEFAEKGVFEAQVWCLQHPQVDAESSGDGPSEAVESDFVKRAMKLLAQGDRGANQLPRILARHTQRSRVLKPATAKALLRLVVSAATEPDAKSTAAYYLASCPADQGVPEDVAKEQKMAAMRDLVERFPGTSSAERAEGFLFVEENLQIGMVAPEIVGKDVDGNDMKLTDFRGKVTVIDFWGFW
ncbi:MAG: hypothetical protein AAGG01_19580 [Planctomycetota bacterium]